MFRKTFVLCLIAFFITQSLVAKTEIAARGYCGDGIMNGTEECDGHDLNFTECSKLKGGDGLLACQPNCTYDISNCSGNGQGLADNINDRIGGLAEVCKCNCNSSTCAGGCQGIENNSTCRFNCDNDCLCQCEGKTSAHIEQCEVLCVGVTSILGYPEIECTLSECDLITSISPNIGDMVVPGTDRRVPGIIPAQ